MFVLHLRKFLLPTFAHRKLGKKKKKKSILLFKNRLLLDDRVAFVVSEVRNNTKQTFSRRVTSILVFLCKFTIIIIFGVAKQAARSIYTENVV